MQVLMAVAFAILLCFELALLVVALSLTLLFPYVLWQRSPLEGGIAAVGLVAVAVALWRSHRVARGEALQVNPQISISHIPISGPVGAIYMLQFLVWVLVAPEIGLLYAALIGAAILLLPVVFYINKPGREPWATGVGGLLGMLCGLVVFTLVSVRQLPLARLFLVAIAAGVIAAPLLIWLRSRQGHVSIAPYSESGQAGEQAHAADGRRGG